MYTNLIVLFALILSPCLVRNAAGDVPGLKSIKKCHEYYNVHLDVPSLKQLTKDDLKQIQEQENSPPPVKIIQVVPISAGRVDTKAREKRMTNENLKQIPAQENSSLRLELDHLITPIFAGGVDARAKELPFMAALGYQNGNESTYICGGSLISDQFVITAAHCIYSREFGQVKTVRLGDLNLTSTIDDINAQEIPVQTYYIHPNYSYPRRYHDIALIKLQHPVTFTSHVKPVCLEAKRAALNFKTFYGAGWGLLGHGEDASSHLQIGKLTHYPLGVCKKTFTKDVTIPDGILDRLQICAGAITHLADTCEGDSGGPLAYFDNTIKGHYLSGITSFGKACALAKIPGVYVRVSHYIGWIEGIVWPETDKDEKRYNDSIIFPEAK